MASPLKAWVRALELTAPIDRRESPILPVLIDSLAERFADVPALTLYRDCLTYRQLSSAIHRYARWAVRQGLQSGDVVCLLMPNCPDYLAIWLGLTRAGVVVALLNTNLTGESLAHCINIVSPRCIISAQALSAALLTAKPYLRGTPAQLLFHELAISEDVLIETPPPSLDDRALLIYTSGTTGLPKAANVSHLRLMQWSHWFAGLMNTQPTDRMYNCLPLYHSVGGVVAVGATWVSGGTVILRERFSAREFWRDIKQERCTLFQYIGELCRYLLSSPPQPEETQHSLRLCCGNGLRPEVWEPFKQRFKIPRILEYYAATEGTFSLYNCEGRPGSIGRIPPFLTHRMPVALVKYDPDAQAPLRDESGLCIRCDSNEPGEAIGELENKQGRFEGYADATASEKKILHNVFKTGDAWYRTGDLMRKDEQGFFYFVDRVGDTFRWKGENVSTGEVATVVTSVPGVTDAAVYGVTVPNADGRAGMAALVINDQFSLPAFDQHLTKHLPDYARPLYLRIVSTIELTSTFKLRKQQLAAEGYDRALISDALYRYDKQQQAYVPL